MRIALKIIKTPLPQLAAFHRKELRPWGRYDSIDIGECFQVKLVLVNPKASLRLQMHHYRDKLEVLVKGKSSVNRGYKVIIPTENHNTHMPQDQNHRLSNPSKIQLEIIEVQNDNYGRNVEAGQ
jgi:mannose-1-phosphate guanylyltransferase / mannose-6-phosphate isomerase